MQHKRILVTGASRGIGYSTAAELSRAGHHVLAAARSQDGLESLLKTTGNQIETVEADLVKNEGLDRITEAVSKLEKPLDGIIHNAGLLINQPFSNMTDDQWRRMLDINLMAPVKLTRELIPYMTKGGHILTIGSMGGFQGSRKFPGLTAYSVTKGALAILSECLSEELKNDQISVNSLCLGAVQTEMLEEAFPGLQAPVTAADMGQYVKEFILNGHNFYNGRILPVAMSDPD
jgi:3-oxoacyl-[acyl-carrier protein] reductase